MSKHPINNNFYNIVRERDKWTCQECGSNEYVQAHHIEHYNGNNNNPKNGITRGQKNLLSNGQKEFQKPIDVVVKEAKLKEEARERLEKSRRERTEFQNIWNKLYRTGE